MGALELRHGLAHAMEERDAAEGERVVGSCGERTSVPRRKGQPPGARGARVGVAVDRGDIGEEEVEVRPAVRLVGVVPRERAELVPNPEYWDKARVPRLERLVLIPMPEASTRTAALLSGQVNWIEAPSPDAIPRLKSAGMRIVMNVYPHHWPYMLNHKRGPFTDLRIRQAANLAINRADILQRIVSGQRPVDIADALHLSIKTVSTHKTRIQEKLKLDSTAALIRFGLEHRLGSELINPTVDDN